MSDSIISVENLGKRYRLRHAAGPAYTTLRDAVTHRARRLFSSSRRPAGSPPAEEDFWALKDVSFEVKRGDVLGIIGRNGAGKSTLLKILSRITEPTTGRIRLKGRVASLLEVGTGFHPELTGRENIFLNGAILGMSKAEIRARFDEIVAFAEVEKFLDTPVKHYSSGMYVRLAFAVAAHLEPEILVVDEVLAVGDAQFQHKCLGKMATVASDGRTVLFVSHTLPAIKALCPNSLFMDRGTVAAAGDTAEILSQYLQQATQHVSLDAELSHIYRSDRPSASQASLSRVTLGNDGPLLHGEAFQAAVAYRVHGEISEVALALGFSTLDGTRILTIDSDVAGAALPCGNGLHCVSIRCSRFYLEPGTYSLDLGLRSGGMRALDYIRDCLRVQVLPGPATPAILTMRSGMAGGWREPMIFELDKPGIHQGNLNELNEGFLFS